MKVSLVRVGIVFAFTGVGIAHAQGTPTSDPVPTPAGPSHPAPASPPDPAPMLPLAEPPPPIPDPTLPLTEPTPPVVAPSLPGTEPKPTPADPTLPGPANPNHPAAPGPSLPQAPNGSSADTPSSPKPANPNLPTTPNGTPSPTPPANPNHPTASTPSTAPSPANPNLPKAPSTPSLPTTAPGTPSPSGLPTTAPGTPSPSGLPTAAPATPAPGAPPLVTPSDLPKPSTPANPARGGAGSSPSAPTPPTPTAAPPKATTPTVPKVPDGKRWAGGWLGVKPDETLPDLDAPTTPDGSPLGTPTEEGDALVKQGRGYIEKVQKKFADKYWYPSTPTAPTTAPSGGTPGAPPGGPDAPAGGADAPAGGTGDPSPGAPPTPDKPKVPIVTKLDPSNGKGGAQAGTTAGGWGEGSGDTITTGWDDPDPDDTWEWVSITVSGDGFGIVWRKKQPSPSSSATTPSDASGRPVPTSPSDPRPSPNPDMPPPPSLPPAGGDPSATPPDHPSSTPSDAPTLPTEPSGAPSDAPSQPTEGGTPAAPTPSSPDGAPVTPAAPTAPATPAAPAAPTHPTAPATPSAPVSPSTPIAPSAPTASSDPASPSAPTSPPAPAPSPSAPPTPSAPAPQAPSSTNGPNAAPASRPLGDASGGASGDEGSGRRGKHAAHSSDWRDWWSANASILRAARPRRVHVTGESGLDGFGGDPMPFVEPPSRRAVTMMLVPTLRRVLATTGGSQSESIAAALVALAKSSDDPADAKRVAAMLGDPRVAASAHEAAAIALGCFRRTKPPPAFDGSFYDGLRTTLFGALDDERQSHRTRCLAALSLGLLGDQANDDHDIFARDSRLVIRGLWLRLERPDVDDDMAVELLVGLSLQNVRGVPSAVRAGLRRLAVAGDTGRRRRGALVRSHAMLALARLGDGEGVGLAMSIVSSASEDANVRRSAILALGLLAPRLEYGQREQVEKLLLVHARRGDPNTAGLALISVAKLLCASLAEGSPSETTVSTLDTLTDLAVRGSAEVRPFAAIAVGLVARPVGAAIDDLAFVEGRERALDRLRRVYADDAEDPGMRGAFAIALGVANDARARVQLEATVVSPRSQAPLAAYACAGLGLMGDVPRSSIKALHGALSGRTPEIVQFEAGRALGLLGETRAVPSLVERLKSAETELALARSVTVLGAVGDGTAIAPMCMLARRRGVNDLTRAIACAGLGMLGDPERTPSLGRLGADSNYLARTETLQDVLSNL